MRHEPLKTAHDVLNLVNNHKIYDIKQLTHGVYWVTLGTHNENIFIEVDFNGLGKMRFHSCFRVFNTDSKKYDIYNSYLEYLTRHGQQKILKFLNNRPIQ